MKISRMNTALRQEPRGRFFGDASLEEAATAREEWVKLRQILAGQPMPEVHAALHKLGGAWQPVDMEEFQSMDAAFMKKAPERPH